jgi:hypothetical protein
MGHSDRLGWFAMGDPVVTAFQALRSFARDTIPTLLREQRGEMAKEAMRRAIEQRFTSGQALPVELERVEQNGRRVKQNAIAWALHDLVVGRVAGPSSGRPTVRLR